MIGELREHLADYCMRYPNESELVESYRELLLLPDAFLRTGRPGHFTASAFIVNTQRNQTLLVKHRKLGIWIQPGGHADGNSHLVMAATREVEEETGLKNCVTNGTIFDLDIHRIPLLGDESAHDHYDVRFLFFANPDTALRISEESTALQWIRFENMAQYTQHTSMLRMLKKVKDLSASA